MDYWNRAKTSIVDPSWSEIICKLGYESVINSEFLESYPHSSQGLFQLTNTKQ
jgi:hypothetical protein